VAGTGRPSACITAVERNLSWARKKTSAGALNSGVPWSSAWPARLLPRKKAKPSVSGQSSVLAGAIRPSSAAASSSSAALKAMP
jgi:hypothetical protein